MIELKREACLIDGQWVVGDAWIDIDDPATGLLVGRVPRLGAVETDRAIAAAERARAGWAARPAKDRAAVLQRFFGLMLEHREDLAALLAQEQGKPRSEARDEITYAAAFVEWYAEEAKRIYGDVLAGPTADKRIMVLKQPIGVVAAITPWNFPAAMVTRKIAPALAAGCAVVVKPAEQTPFTALALGALAQAAGLPDGLLNIVTGDAVEIGQRLTASPIVRKLSFTGSTAVGSLLYAQCAPTVKKLSLELGGNAPFILFDDADVDAAVEGAIQSKFRNAGQTCVCTNRIYVQRGVHDLFVTKLIAAAELLKVGPSSDSESQVGPLIDDAAVAKILAHIGDAVNGGAKIETGGGPAPAGGRFMSPTILTGVTGEMRVMREETFGPVAAIMSFEDEAEAIALANSSEAGLAAYVYTRDLSRAWRFVEKVETGMVGVNTGLISTELAPFGGIKTSGLGREGARQGIDEYLETKYACIAV